MFESAALALCRHSRDGVDWSEALLSSSQLLTTTLMGGCSWGELSNVAWSYATHSSCGTPGAGLMIMFLANKATSQILSSVANRIRGNGKVGEFRHVSRGHCHRCCHDVVVVHVGSIAKI
jgi:hypothetical protein